MALSSTDLEFGHELISIVGSCIVCNNIPMEKVMECASCSSLYCDACLPEKDVKCNEIRNVLECPKCLKNSKQIIKESFSGNTMQR
jgi:hypothetical protein